MNQNQSKFIDDENMNIYCCDPNDINKITYNYDDIITLCIENKIEWKNQTNQTFMSFVTELKNN